MAKKHTFDYDLIVIGSGAGGSAAATIAAQSGKRVAIIEEDTFGGDSPNYSDIPTRALLHAAQLYDEAKHGARFGLRSNTLGYNFPSLRAWKDLAVKRTGAGGNKRFYETHGVTPIHGRAHFLSAHEITVNRRHLSAAKFLMPEWLQGITGYLPLTPVVDGIRYITTEGATLLELGPQLAIIGIWLIAIYLLAIRLFRWG